MNWLRVLYVILALLWIAESKREYPQLRYCAYTIHLGPTMYGYTAECAVDPSDLHH